MASRDRTVGVLSLHESKESKAILNAVEALGHRAEWLTRENLAFGIDGGEVTLDPDADVVVNRLLLSNTEYPAEKLGLAGCYDAVRPLLNRPGPVLAAMHKLYAATVLATSGVPVPDAYLALDPETFNRNRSRFGDVAVYKTAIGTHGGGTWRVSGDESLSPLVGQRLSFLQRFVETGGDRHHDLRVYVVDGDVVAAMSRYAAEDDWRTNIARGGEGVDETATLPESAARAARAAVDALGLDLAGVDLIEDADGWLVLEVNPTAGFRGLFRATGVNVAPYIARAAIERVGGEVDPDRVATLVRALDDTEPACSPKRRAQADRPRPVIGYTTQVVVAGTTGTETVTAKADTGASRTSIDLNLAARIGAGPIKRRLRVRSGSRKSGRTRPVVDVVVGVGGDQYTVAATVEDRSHMTHPVLLGRDILEEYRVVARGKAEE